MGWAEGERQPSKKHRKYAESKGKRDGLKSKIEYICKQPKIMLVCLFVCGEGGCRAVVVCTPMKIEIVIWWERKPDLS